MKAKEGKYMRDLKLRDLEFVKGRGQLLFPSQRNNKARLKCPKCGSYDLSCLVKADRYNVNLCKACSSVIV